MIYAKYIYQVGSWMNMNVNILWVYVSFESSLVGNEFLILITSPFSLTFYIMQCDRGEAQGRNMFVQSF